MLIPKMTGARNSFLSAHIHNKLNGTKTMQTKFLNRNNPSKHDMNSKNRFMLQPLVITDKHTYRKQPIRVKMMVSLCKADEKKRVEGNKKLPINTGIFFEGKSCKKNLKNAKCPINPIQQKIKIFK